MSQVLLDMYYNLLNNKLEQDMQIVLDWFVSGTSRLTAKEKEAFKARLLKNPITFTESQSRQKEIYDKILSLL
jgi:hypothetical protein